MWVKVVHCAFQKNFTPHIQCVYTSWQLVSGALSARRARSYYNRARECEYVRTIWEIRRSLRAHCFHAHTWCISKCTPRGCKCQPGRQRSALSTKQIRGRERRVSRIPHALATCKSTRSMREWKINAFKHYIHQRKNIIAMIRFVTGNSFEWKVPRALLSCKREFIVHYNEAPPCCTTKQCSFASAFIQAECVGPKNEKTFIPILAVGWARRLSSPELVSPNESFESFDSPALATPRAECRDLN